MYKNCSTTMPIVARFLRNSSAGLPFVFAGDVTTPRDAAQQQQLQQLTRLVCVVVYSASIRTRETTEAEQYPVSSCIHASRVGTPCRPSDRPTYRLIKSTELH